MIAVMYCRPHESEQRLLTEWIRECEGIKVVAGTGPMMVVGGTGTVLRVHVSVDVEDLIKGLK